MSNLATVEENALEAVTGGTTTTTRTAACTTGDNLLATLNGLSTTIQNLNTAANKTGFSTTDLLMLGILMSQSRPAVSVFVRRPFW